jgi:hypothetical protein
VARAAKRFRALLLPLAAAAIVLVFGLASSGVADTAYASPERLLEDPTSLTIVGVSVGVACSVFALRVLLRFMLSGLGRDPADRGD